MFDVYLIEVRDEAAGLVTRDGDAFRFHAANPAYAPLDGQIFVDPEHAERSARKLAGGRGRRKTGAPTPLLAAE